MINFPPADWKHIQAQIAAASKQSMHAGTHFTDLGKLSELYRERRLPNIPVSAEPGMEPGTLGLEGRDLTTGPTPLL